MHKQEVEQDYLIKTEETLQAVFDRRNGAVDVGNGLESVCVCVLCVYLTSEEESSEPDALRSAAAGNAGCRVSAEGRERRGVHLRRLA